MANKFTYEGYHATDEQNANKIILEGFRYTPNNRHWLGQGFYFFLDKELIKDWIELQPKGYGKISTPACIKCIIEISKEHLLDLRFLDDYNFVKQCFDKFIISITGKYDINNVNREELRTLFFDYVKAAYGIHCIVAYFNERNNLSVQTEQVDLFDKIKVPYTEVQLCLNRNKYIKSKEVVNL